jgi:DNA-3-methyladenine glycosylase I
MDKSIRRCKWATNDDLIKYHDTQWGVPVHDDDVLFEMLTLEGAQAGLSWDTILKRRSGYSKAFDNFDIDIVSRYTKKDVTKLLQDKGIIRNKLKIESAISNAGCILKIQKEFGSFDRYIWGFVDFTPIINSPKSLSDVVTSNELSLKISNDLRKRGFRFVGPTICYAFMQAIGIVSDHTRDCFRYKK